MSMSRLWEWMRERTCDCEPGTEEGGWVEKRSAQCLREEREAFEAAIVGYRLHSVDGTTVIAEYRNGRMLQR